MRVDGFRVVALAAILLVVPLAAPMLLTTDPASMFSADVLDSSRSAADPFRVDAFGREATVILGDLPALDPARDALVIANPTVGYTLEEKRALQAFIEAGGRLLLVLGSGVSFQLLADLGAGVASEGVPVYTPAFNGTPDRLVALSTGLLPLPEEVVVQKAYLVTGGEPILRTADLAWQDRNDNGRPDLGEPVRGGALATRAALGGGTVFVVGDVSFFSQPPEVLRVFVDALAEDDRRLVFDEGHRALSDPLGAQKGLSGHTSAVTGTVILITTLAGLAVAVLAPRMTDRRPPRPSPPRADDREGLLAEALLELDPR